MIYRNKKYLNKDAYPLEDKYRKLLCGDDARLIIKYGHWVTALISGQTRPSNRAEKQLLRCVVGLTSEASLVARAWINYLKVQPAIHSTLFDHISDIDKFSKWESNILEKHSREAFQLLDRKQLAKEDWHYEIFDIAASEKRPRHEIARVWFKYQKSMPVEYRTELKDISGNGSDFNPSSGSFDHHKYSGRGTHGEAEKAQTEDFTNFDGNRLR
jgi:uncharacterized protein YifE (UPF0438 family)